MVIIKNILEVPRKPKLRKIIDSQGEVYYLSVDIMYMEKIKPQITYEDSKWQDILLQSDVRIGMDYSFDYLSRGMRTIYEVRTKLVEKKISQQAIDSIINRLIELEYLDDDKYANEYVNTYRTARGKIRLRNELKFKGVDRDIIDKFLLYISDERDVAQELAIRFNKDKIVDDKQRARIIRHLLSRGFNYDTIKQVLGDIGGYNDLSDI